MLFTKQPKTFGIDLTGASESNLKKFNTAMKKLTDIVPGFVVEGIGNKMPEAPKRLTTTLNSCWGFDYLATEFKPVAFDMVYFGNSSKFDAEFGFKSNNRLAGTPFKAMHTFNLATELSKILDAIAAYVKSRYGVKVVFEDVTAFSNVQYFSQYVIVDGTAMSYANYELLSAPKFNSSYSRTNPTIAYFAHMYGIR